MSIKFTKRMKKELEEKKRLDSDTARAVELFGLKIDYGNRKCYAGIKIERDKYKNAN